MRQKMIKKRNLEVNLVPQIRKTNDKIQDLMSNHLLNKWKINQIAYNKVMGMIVSAKSLSKNLRERRSRKDLIERRLLAEIAHLRLAASSMIRKSVTLTLQF